MSAEPVYRVPEFDILTSFSDVAKLCDRWSANRHLGNLPQFENVAVGRLGTLAEDTALLRPSGTDFQILRMGTNFQKTIGATDPTVLMSSLGPNFRAAIGAAARNAAALSRPVLTTTHVLAERTVRTCEFLALPLRDRWGDDLIFGFLRPKPISYDLVEAIFAATSDGLLALAAIETRSGRPDFQIVTLNKGAEAVFGRSADELCWTSLSNVVGVDRFEAIIGALSETLKNACSHSFNMTVEHPGGAEIHLKASVSPVGDLLGMALTNITEVRRRENSMRLLFGSNPMPLTVYDPADGRLLEANDAFLERYDYAPADLGRLHIADLYPQGRWTDTATHERERRESGQSGRERRHVTAKGDARDVLVYARDLPYEGRDCVIATIIDVTEQRRTEERMAYLAHHDAITGLANRVLFKAGLSSSLAARLRDRSVVAVHCIDLDCFKQVNDTFGHPMGDALLVQVAERLRATAEEGDLIARLGGDEFAVVQTGLMKPDEAAELAARLVELISAPYDIDGQRVVIGASIGVALAPTDGLDADQLLKNADIALYKAKTGGRGCFVFFEAAMQQSIQERRLMEVALRRALADHEFSLKFQPLVEIESGRIIGFEALLRWNSADRGSVSPDNFIPLAEETGLIVPIGDWVLRQACCEAASWPRDITVAVNVSPVQFKARSLVASVSRALAQSGLNPARLELEITESVLLADSDTNIAMLRQLRQMGVKISMDDFGTGYSSLSYLRSFPFDKIKIDKSFIRDLEESEDCRAIVRAVVGLGTSLGIKTLAEGVETLEQLNRLGREGCREVQGYLFSPPVSADQLAGFVGLQPDQNDRAA